MQGFVLKFAANPPQKATIYNTRLTHANNKYIFSFSGLIVLGALFELVKRLIFLAFTIVVFGAYIFTPSAHQEYVNFYSWYGVVPIDIIKQFEEETGIKVRYDMYDSNDTLEAKLLATNAGYDVVVPSISPYLGRGIQTGLYQKLDWSKLPNAKHIDPKVYEYSQVIDPERGYGVPYFWGSIGIAYVKEKVQKVLPDADLSSINFLFKPENIKKLSRCGVSMLDEHTDVLPMAAIYLGLDPNTDDREEIKKIEQFMLSIRPHILRFSGTRFVMDLAAGQTCVAMAWSGEAQAARELSEDEDNGYTIEYVVPKEGSILWVDVLAIPKGAPNVENAYKLINFLLRPDIAAKMTKLTYIGTTNVDSRDMLPENLRNDSAIFPPDEVLSRMKINKMHKPQIERLLNRIWTKIRFAKHDKIAW